MDSKLVVEQMSGRWKIKHPDMRPLAAEASRLAPAGTTYTWVPREQNKHADRLANEALDGTPRRRHRRRGAEPARRGAADSLIEEVESPERRAAAAPAAAGRRPAGRRPRWSWCGTASPPHTVEKRFSGGLASANPGLSDEGRAQVRATADWLAPLAERVDAVVASPYAAPCESAEIVAEVLGKTVEVEPGFAEMEFGTWDGLTFTEVAEQHRRRARRLAGLARRGARRRRVVRGWSRSGCSTGCSGVLDAHAGKTVRRGQPRDADQDAGRARRRRAARRRCSGWSCRPASVTVRVVLPRRRGRHASRGLDAAVQRAAARQRRRSAGDRAGSAAQTSLTTTSSWVPLRPGSPSSTSSRGRAAGRRARPGCAGCRRPRARRGPAGPWWPC